MPPPPETAAPSVARRNAAYYEASVADFLSASDDEVYGALTSPHGFSLTPEQLSAWRQQLPVLRSALADEAGWIHLEFDIPRLGRQVDAVLVSGCAVLPIEFKVGAKKVERLN